MRGNKKIRGYVPGALEHLGKCLLNIRQPGNAPKIWFRVQLKLDGLQEAVQALDKSDREKVEKFWGLTGGPNHSKKLGRVDLKDVAYREMSTQAVIALRKLLTLDYAIMYDPSISIKLDLISKKVNKGGLQISDMECAKHLMAFFIYADNGPKMSFEEDPLSIDDDLKENFLFDEYEVLNQMCQEFSKYPDKSINMRLLISFFEMIDFKDMLAIKKSMGMEILEESLPEEFKLEDVESIQPIRTVSQIRELKERMFPYGAWDVATTLLLGGKVDRESMNTFMEALDSIRKDWSKIAEFNSGEKTLKTGSELRKLKVYNIGGLQFTDIYEVMFLYLERNHLSADF